MKAAVTIDPVKAVLNVPVVAITDPAVKAGPAIWIAKLRTGHAVIFQASVSKTSNAGAEEADSVGIASAAADLAAVIALAVVALAAEDALVDSVAAAGVDGKNLGLGFVSNFPYNQKT